MQSLELSGCGWLSHHSIMALAKLPELIELDLRGCFRMGEVFAYTALATRCGFKRLERLDLRDTSINDMEWSCYGRLPKIRSLLAGRSLKTGNNDLDEGLTDRGVSSLTAMVQQGAAGGGAHLSEIVLTRTGVTNGVMGALGKAFSSLSSVDVRGTRVTEAGATELNRWRPDCRVLFDPEKENPLANKPPSQQHNPDHYILIQAPTFQ